MKRPISIYTEVMATRLTAPITLEDLERLPDDANTYEVSDGELIVMPTPKSLHSLIALRVLEILQAFLKEHPFGRAIPESGYVLSREPLTVRQPDVSVLSNQRIHATDEDGYFESSPELAVEVVSPSDSAQDLETKVSNTCATAQKPSGLPTPSRSASMSSVKTPHQQS